MQSAWFDATIAWISAHPHAAGGLVFLIAFCDALAVVGIVVPALPLLFAVGTLIGLGHLDGPYALLCAAAGAFAGDALSYWIGHRWGTAMRGLWLFRRYPGLLDRGEQLFRRHGSKGIVIARFIGAVRPFVPAVAGMLHMPLRRYVPASVFAALSWAAVFLAPGWIFGASYDAVAAVADKLVLVLLGVVLAIALVWALVLYTWRWFAAHADNLLARALRWTRAHPRLGRYAAALIDPRRPESASLIVLAVCLFAMAWLWAGFTAWLLVRGEPLLFDREVQALMFSLRNPLADRTMAALAAIGSAPALGAGSIAVLGWLGWRKRWMAAAHWLAAIAVGLAITVGLGALVEMPRPPTAPLEVLQRELLTTAARLLAPGGRLLYSTCTTNERENEAQVRFALDHLGLEPEPLPEFPGFGFAPSLPGCLLVNGAESAAQGFFLAGLRKAGSVEVVADHADQSLPGQIISASEFAAQTGLDTNWLPPHRFLAVGGRIYLIVDQALAWLPSELRWQGFGVGKMAKDAILPDPALRLFVPPHPDACASACATTRANRSSSRPCAAKATCSPPT